MKPREFDWIGKRVIVLCDRKFPLYIIKGDTNFLVDAGVSAGAKDYAKGIEKALGANKGIQTLLLTHTHFDHTGAISYLQEKYGFDILASHRAVQLLERKKVVEIIEQLNKNYEKMIGLDSGVNVEMPENLSEVKEGDRIAVSDGVYLEVYETPGHTQCSVSFLLHPDGVLFPGDATGLAEQDGMIKPLFLSHYGDYEKSLEKLSGLNAETLALPHNRVIRGQERVARYLKESLKRTRDFRENMLAYLDSGGDIKQIARMILEREFPAPTLLGPREALLTNIESMVKAVRKS